MSFTLPALPFAPSALAARGMSQETIEYHYGKHHQAYVTALNGLVEKNEALKGKSLEELIKLSYGKEELQAGIQQRRPALEPFGVLGMSLAERWRHSRHRSKRS